ncbi:MAG: beta-ketoacyl-[acyl-carrier-protein] synthase II, partial [Bacteroidales bacterium]|nr:beta-ketoacyl-[acyl-carrier-protein] synthase II [Bacteroidales bacterium]
MELKRVVVTGLGTINPLGNDVETTWANALAGNSGAGPITHFDTSLFKTKFGCEVKDFDPNDLFERKEARKYDRYSHFALQAAKEAMEDSGLDLESENR